MYATNTDRRGQDQQSSSSTPTPTQSFARSKTASTVDVGKESDGSINVYTCSSCRQPLMSDALTKEQYDSVVNSLPPPSTPSTLSPNTKLSGIPASLASKRAYLETTRSSSTFSNTANGHVQGHGHPAESFVLLSGSRLDPDPGSIPHPRPSDRSVGSTILLPSSSSSNSIETHLPNPTDLFAILSSKTSYDHPICSICASTLQQDLQGKLEELQKERDAYIGFEREWSGKIKVKRDRRRSGVASGNDHGNEKEPVDGDKKGENEMPLDDEEYNRLRIQQEEIKVERDALLTQLLAAEEEERQLSLEESLLDQQEHLLSLEQDEFFHTYHQASTNHRELQQRLSTAKTLQLIQSQTLARLEATNVYNDVFQIGHVPLLTYSSSSHPSSIVGGTNNGSTPGSSKTKTHADQLRTQSTSSSKPDRRHESSSTTNTTFAAGIHHGQTVGTINGLRLGGRPIVDWGEINAGLGLVILCMDRAADKVGCVFENYKLIPLGSFSRIDELPPSRNSYELYASTDLSAARLLQNRRFNYALVGMLDCLRQLVNWQKGRNRGWGGTGLEIVKDKIAGHSIKLNANMGMTSVGFGSISTTTSSEGEESWTKALRAVLTVLKRLLVIESEADREEVMGQVR